MADIVVLNDSMVSAADYSSSGQWRFVRISGDRTVTKGVTTEGDAVYGVLANDPATSQPASVAVLGVTRVVAAAVIAAGARVMSATDGTAKTATAAKYAAGVAREAGVTGQEVSIFLIPGSAPVPA